MRHWHSEREALKAETKQAFSGFDGLIVGIAAISLIRGVTRLEDFWFYPGEPHKSAWASIALGLFLIWVKGDDIRQALMA